MAELCYSGWYMGFSVQSPIISLGKNVMAWSHSQEQGKLVLECWRFMWVYSTTSTWGSKVTCQSRQLFAFASCFSSELVTHGFFLLVPLWQELWVLTRWEFFSCFRISLLWWKSLSTNSVTLLQVTKVWRLRCEKCPRKGQFPSAIKSALKENIVLSSFLI